MSYDMKIHPMRAELFHVDGLTNGRIDMTKLTVSFHNFENAPKTLSHDF
jgi:hypothetical protein